MSWGENQRIYGIIVFQSESEDELAGMPRFVSSELIRFGRSSPVFHSSPKSNTLFTLEYEGLYLKDGSPWGHPYREVLYQYPNISIRVHYRGDNQSEWESVAFGEEEDKRGQLAQLEEYLANEFNLPLKKTSTEQPTIEEEPEPSSVNFENQTDPAQERRENTEKIKDLIGDGQEALALQLIRSLNDPEIYEALLSDCCEISDYDEDEGWIQTSELFEGHDALFYQLLAHAPEESDLPGPLRLESIENIHLNNCSSISNLDFLRDYPRLKSFSIWGWGEDAADLDDISGLEGLTRLKSLQLKGLKSSLDWTPLQHLVQLRELTLSDEQLTHPGPLVFSRLTKLNSLTLNEAKSLRSLSFLESLESLRCLRIDGYGGDSLKGIGKCRQITEFSISDAGKLEDITELSSLSRLRELTLCGKFQNLDPLNSLASLQTLYINDAKELRDVSGLSGCQGLERINLYGASSLGSLWGIGQLKSLQELQVYSWESTSGYIDIHEVRELSNLRDLTISCSGRVLRGFSTVRRLEKLRSLDLSGCNCRGVTDLSPLRKLKLLNSLKMANCQSVTNLNGLSNLHCLEILELIGLPRLASLSGLREFDQLQQLTITGCTEIEGLDDLANLTGLTRLELRYFYKLRDASGIHGMTQLEALDLEGSEWLSDISFLDSLENLNSLDLSCCNRIHPDDFVHLNEDDLETLCLPDTDEYEDDECEEDEEQENPWGECNLTDIPHDEWLRLYDKDNEEKGSGLLQEAVYNRWLDQVPEHILTNENLLAVEAIHIAAISCDFNQLPSSLLTVENLLAEDADHHWNVFHFAAGYGSLDLLPAHLLVEKNLQVPTRVDCLFFDNIFAGSTCLHIVAARGALTLLPRFLLTPQNLLLKDEKGNTALDQAEAWLQTNQDKINDLKDNDADQSEIAGNEDWLKTAQIQIAHLRHQVAEAEILEEPEVEAEVTESDEKQDEPLFDSDGENSPISEPELAVAGEDDLSSHPTEQPELVEQDQHNGHPLDLPDDEMFGDRQRVLTTHDASKLELFQQSADSSHTADHLAEQTEPVGQEPDNEPAIGIIDKGMSNDEQAEPLQRMNVTELSLDNESAPQEEEPIHKINITELSLDNQPAMQEAYVPEEPVAEEPVVEEPVAEEPVAEEPVAEEPVAEEPVAEEPVAEEPVAEEPVAEEPVAEEPVAEEPVAEEPVVEEPVVEEPVVEEPVAEEPVVEEPVVEEPVAEEPVAEEPVAEEPVAEEPVVEEPVVEEPAIEEEISPLVMNTWFHNLGEAIAHPKAVVTLDIIHQESMDRLGVLSEFPYLEELHFIKVNIDNFKDLIPAPKLCHIKFESCEVNGWMGLLDLQGLKKVGCYPGVPPEKVKQLLEESGVEIYLFTPTRINNSEASGAPESVPKTQVIYEEAIA